MSERHPKLLLQDILESAEKVEIYTRSLTYNDFIDDGKTIDAVIRNIEIIGEASIRLPDALKDETPEIDWFKIRGLRNRIVHGYFGINYKVIWDIVVDYVPELIIQITKLMNEY
ncbi:MAG TPA: DUF86 domain-containing protein [Mucilaginibacter sp.]|jgi:uncharacterized protein with HEPN domain|nr:DUF86 domain-containing protein [Mucilaginibacter sp.]